MTEASASVCLILATALIMIKFLKSNVKPKESIIFSQIQITLASFVNLFFRIQAVVSVRKTQEDRS